MWFVFALLSAVFAALTSILAKIGIAGVNSNLATAIRTMVVLVMAWGMVFLTNTQGGIAAISKKSWLFLMRKKSFFLSDFQVSRQELPGSVIIVLCR